MIKTFLATERLHIFSSQPSSYSGYRNIEHTFFQEFELEQTGLINTMSKLKLKDFGTYSDNFTALVSEFECVGGKRQDPIIQALFISNIPEKYSSEKNTYIDQA